MLPACHGHAKNDKGINSSPIINGYGIHYPHGWGGAVPNQLPTGVNLKLAKELENYANGQHATSTPDSIDHELFQLAPGGANPTGVWYSSFHEHNGHSEGGIVKGQPFTQFWLDDNWLARFMSESYGEPLPDGLWTTTDFNRWQILAMDNSNWVPYENSESFVDQ